MALMTTLPRTFSLSTPALLVAFLLSPLAYADQLVESHITAVTVHPGVARVTREASFELPAGEQTVILHGLPAALDEASLQLEGKGNGLKIGAMEIRHLQSADLAQPEAQALKAKLTELQAKSALLSAREQALTTQQLFLQSLASSPQASSASRAMLPPEQWLSGAKALGEGMREVGEARVTLMAEQQQNREQLSVTERELARLQAAARESRALAVALQSGGGKVTLDLGYQIAGASWQPVYEAALDTRSGQVTLTRAALVQQASGEAWDKVALTLATSRPLQGSMPPELDSWWIDLFDESQLLRQREAQEKAGAERQMLMKAAPAPAAMADNAVAAAEPQLAQLDAGDFVAEYRIAGLVSVAPNQDRQRVVLASEQSKVDLSLQSVPRLDPHAYLYAGLKNQSGAPWLAGQWRLSRDGAFIGERYQPQVAKGEALSLSFGVDDAVQVTATQLLDEQGESGVLNKQRTLSRQWRYLFHSGHSQALPLTILDNWPVPRNEQIKVEPLEGSPKADDAQVEGKAGVMRWQRSLPAGGELELKPGYRISYPYPLRLQGV